MDLSLEEYFRYHAPRTETRIQNHQAVNSASLVFAKVVDSTVQDEDCKKMALFAIQQARMFANQGVTIDELRQNK